MSISTGQRSITISGLPDSSQTRTGTDSLRRHQQNDRLDPLFPEESSSEAGSAGTCSAPQGEVSGRAGLIRLRRRHLAGVARRPGESVLLAAVVLLRLPLTQIIIGGAGRLPLRGVRIEAFFSGDGYAAIVAHPDHVEVSG
jgi:hypothetical protein